MRQPSNDDCNADGDKSLSEPWIGVTRFELLNKDPPEGHMWVSRQTDEEAGVQKTWIQLAGRIVKQRGIYFIPDDGLDMDELVHTARRKLEIRRGPAMPCEVTTAADPDGSSWRATLFQDGNEKIEL